MKRRASTKSEQDTYLGMVENAPFGIYVINAEFKLVQISLGARKVFGVVQDPIGKDLEEVLRQIWSEPFVSEAIIHFRHTLATGQSYHSPSTVQQRADSGDTEAYDWKIDRVLLPGGAWGMVCYFFDLTEHDHTQQLLREAEKRQTFLLKLSDALRPMADPVGIQAEACRLLGEHLGTDRAYYAEIDEAAGYAEVRQDFLRGGSPSLAGRFLIADFGWMVPSMRRGEMLVVPDVGSVPLISPPEREMMSAIRIAAHINAPLVKAGVLVGALCVTKPTPRPWTVTEADLVLETSERIWAAVGRARAEEALRIKEQHLRLATEAARTYSWEVDLRTGATRYSANTEEVIGRPPASSMEENNELLHPDDRALSVQAFDAAVAPGSTGTLNYEVRSIALPGETRWLHVTGNIERDASGTPVRCYGISQDITHRKRREAVLVLLSEVSEDLLNTTDLDATVLALCEKLGAHFSATVCGFSEVDKEAGRIVTTYVWHHPDAMDPPGVHPIEQFPNEEVRQLMRSGRPEIVRDTATFPEAIAKNHAALKLGAYVNTPLVREGQWRATLSLVDSSPRDWRADEIELMRELTTRVWTRVERARAEKALRGSEDKYRTLFGSIDEGVTVVEVIYDEEGKPSDYSFIEHNPHFERLTGSKPPIGTTALESIPGIEQYWIDLVGEVARTGESVRTEYYSEASFGRWYSAFLSRIGGEGSRRVVCVYNDISARRRREANLAFLDKVSADLVGLTNIGETMDALGEKIGAYFGVARCGFFEFNEAADGAVCEYDWHAKADDPSLVGEYRTADFYTNAAEFVSTLRAGEAFVLGDGKADPRVVPANLAALDIRSFVIVPTDRAAGMPLVVLALNDNKPRDWSKDEIDLMREVTTRIWTRLERARAEQALVASEEKYRTLFENIDEGFCLLNILFDEAGEAHDYVFLEANPAFEKQSGLVGAVGGHIAELVPDMEPHWIRMMVQVARTGEPIRFEADVASMGRCFDLYAFSGGENKVAVVFNDITERKRREANLAFLSEVSVDLARLANIDETMDAVGAKVAAHLGLSACAFAELDGAADIATINHGWHRSGMPSLLGTYRMEEFMAAEVVQDCRAGKAVVVSDVFADPRVNGEQYAALGIGSFASIPLMRDGVWGFLLVAYRPGPCNWREDEIDLMREMATRIWTRLERARAEAELHRSQERYQAFMQHSTEGIYRCELDRLIPLDMPVDEVLDFAYEHTYLAECNDAMARMYGHDSGKELEGARLGDLTPRTPENEAFLTAFLTNGFKLEGGESQEQHCDGHTVYFRNNLFGIVEDGFLVRVWGTQTDITAQHQAELDLRASLELYRLSSEASAGMLYDYDPHTDRIMRAGAVEAITGVPLAEVPELGSWWTERIHPEDLAAQLALVPDIIAARKENHVGEYRVRHAKGHWVHVMDKSRWIYDEAGTLIRMVGNTVDVSDRVRALAELHEENERKNEFIATLSHELRNPLAPLRTGIQLLGEPPYDEATTRPVVKMMERQVDHMVHLIEDLMDLNRISRGKIELRVAELDLHAPLLQALESVAPQMKAKGHTVVRELAGSPLIHMGDATRLAQVFGNLLENAAKYTAPGGTITVRTQVQGTHARITFTDTGGGIEAEDLPRVFGMFAQIRKDNEFAQGGIGIGLHIVKRLVEMHHGTIEVSSAGRGQGSAFTVSLPIAASLASKNGTVNASALAPLAPLRILLTDDNVDAANSLAMLLKKAGHEVEVAHNGASALEKGERSAPQVLVLDIGMPGMDGYDLCRRIRGTSWGASSYIIALTGWGQEDDRQKALEAGFDHHLVKPVGRKELEGALAAVGRTVVAG